MKCGIERDYLRQRRVELSHRFECRDLVRQVVGKVGNQFANPAQKSRRDQLRRPILVKAIALVFVLLALFIILAGVLYATNVPMALQSVERAGSAAKQGVTKSIVKTVVQLVSYPIGMLVAARWAWTSQRSES